MISTPNDVQHIQENIRFVFLKHTLDVRVIENNSKTLNKVLSNHFQKNTVLNPKCI